jgi:Bacterial regulatory helix-turn-helix protein, lysR family
MIALPLKMPRPGVPSLDQLAVFLTVVETGSFAAAGRRLGRATSAVSYAIANLASDRSRKAVTDSTRSGLRPIPLARPPEFVVCPLMREIRAFRYFWPGR